MTLQVETIVAPFMSEYIELYLGVLQTYLEVRGQLEVGLISRVIVVTIVRDF